MGNNNRGKWLIAQGTFEFLEYYRNELRFGSRLGPKLLGGHISLEQVWREFRVVSDGETI